MKKKIGKTYIPSPINTKDVQLSDELLKLTEFLASNSHDTWAMQRLSEGWVYGNYRDDIRKTHPCLIPYEGLPDSEKEYDRRTALETLRVIIKLGYKIIKD
jgi:hypothetical protein